MVFAPEVSPNSWKLLEMLEKPTCSMIGLLIIMELVGFTRIPNYFHDSRNSAPAPEVSPKFMATCPMICLWGIMEYEGFANIANDFHDCRNYGSGLLQIHGNGRKC